MTVRTQGFVGTHVRKLGLGLFALVVALSFALGAAVPARAADQVSSLPFVNNFATARFKVLSTIKVDQQTVKSFGEGSVVLPDRTSAWVGTDSSDVLTYIIQIGTTVYQRVGSGEWQRNDNAALASQPVSEQFNELQQFADAVLFIGDEQVGNTPTKHYQVWLSGQKILDVSGIADDLPADLRDFYAKSTYKFDFWVGGSDTFLLQQNVEVILPAGKYGDQDLPNIQTDTLTTFYDINNPNISINAPQ